jgi:transcription elongation factor Elf1
MHRKTEQGDVAEYALTMGE